MANKLTYNQQLKHPKWQKKRLEILDDRNYTCQICEDTEKTLHVHHGVYEKDKLLWEYHRDTLWCLCDSCHKETHIHIYNIKQTIARINPYNFDEVSKVLMVIYNVENSVKIITRG